MEVWQLQEAKSKLSQLVKSVLNFGPHGISIHGQHSVVILSKKDYDKLTKRKSNFAEFIEKSPLKGVKLDLERDKSEGREIEL